MECSIINPALLLLMKHLVIGQCQKAPNVSAFHWSPHNSKHEGSTFTERTETSIITESDQAVQAMHSCNSWLKSLSIENQLLDCLNKGIDMDRKDLLQ